MTVKISQRKRFFIAVEGEGDRSFIKWVGQLAEQEGLHVHLDCHPLGGGGYKAMLKKAVAYNKKKKETKGTPKSSILLVDSDRAAREDDGWTLTTLKAEANKEKIALCLQQPNQEGLLYRMTSGNERAQVDANNAQRLLRTVWPDYEKPVDTRTLETKYTLADLLRVAKVDIELRKLLEAIGLMQ